MTEGTCKNEKVTVPVRSARRLIFEIFLRSGCNEGEARRVSKRLVDANMRGHDSHGMIRSGRYVQWLKSGRVRANQNITIEKENESLAVIDGNYGLGQTVGEQTIDVGIAKVKKNGVAVTALKNAGHLGCIADWAMQAADANIASIHFVNVRGSMLVAPYGGASRRFGTSPFCCGVPMQNGDNVILDFATSMVAEGKALVALFGGEQLPQGSLIDAEGVATNDPRNLYGPVEDGELANPTKGSGALTVFGLHKGSGLSFFIELLAGALTGSGTNGALNEIKPRRFCNGMLSIYLDPESFVSSEWFSNEVRSFIDFIKSASPITLGREVLIPGENEKILYARHLEAGLTISNEIWVEILSVARGVGMDDSAIDAAINDRPN